MHVYTQNSEINREEWFKLVTSSATCTWFQTPDAYDFFASMPELFRTFVVAISNDTSLSETQHSINSSLLRAVCVGYVTKERNPLKQFFTRRAIILGGPCLADNCSENEVIMLMRAVRKKLKNEAIYVECRNFNDYSQWQEAFEKAGFEYYPHLNFHVDCTDREKMWERLSENRCRQVRKAQGTVECSSNERVNESEIREWYSILENLYKRKVKTPLWPVEFFLEAYRQGVGKFFLVKHKGKVIGGSFCVELKRIKSSIINHKSSINTGVVYEWFECGLNSEYKEMYPSVMATWAGMAYAAEHGCARYDMMGAGEPDVPYGVRDFKAEFGGELVEHGRFLCVCKPLLFSIGKMGVRFLKR